MGINNRNLLISVLELRPTHQVRSEPTMSTEKIYYHLEWPNPSCKSDTIPAVLHDYTNNEILAERTKVFGQMDHRYNIVRLIGPDEARYEQRTKDFPERGKCQF